MASIGSFKKVGNEFLGQIVTLSVQAKAVRIAPEANRANGNAPSHRVFVGKADWTNPLRGIRGSPHRSPRSAFQRSSDGRQNGRAACSLSIRQRSFL